MTASARGLFRATGKKSKPVAVRDLKADHLAKWRKDRPAHWVDQYEHDVMVLGWAAVGYEKLAERESA